MHGEWQGGKHVFGGHGSRRAPRRRRCVRVHFGGVFENFQRSRVKSEGAFSGIRKTSIKRIGERVGHSLKEARITQIKDDVHDFVRNATRLCGKRGQAGVPSLAARQNQDARPQGS